MGEPGQALDEHDPRRIGPYLIIRRLGGGGMGTVYLGRTTSARRVAVKVVHPHLPQQDSLFRERFAREVAAAEQVDGFFTARVLDADPGAPLPWMATEYIVGDTVAGRVAGSGPLAPPEVWELAAAVAEALAAMHAVGVVHRDLKPGNVILSPDGPRVIDFGIAQAVGGTHRTELGMVSGTVGYMSPEQAAGRQVEASSDVFSLGGLIHYAATGAPVFDTGAQPAVVLHQVLHQEPDLSRIADPQLRELVSACLRKDPPVRPTASQVQQACTAAMALDAGPPPSGSGAPVPAEHTPEAGVEHTPAAGVEPTEPIAPPDRDP